MKKNSSTRDEFKSQKFMATLQEIMKENFTVSDDTILDKLFSNFEHSSTITDHLMMDIAGWLETIFNGWNESEYFYGVKVFAVRLIGLIGSSVDGFWILEEKKILLYAQNLASSDEVQQDSCLMVPLINVFILFLKHQMGWKWITKTMVWKCAVKAFHEDRSIYTKRAGVQFLSLLLEKSDEYDSNVGIDILSVIFEPLLTSKIFTIAQCSQLNDENSSKDKNSDDEYVVRIRDNGEVVDVTPQLASSAKFASDIIGEILSKPNSNVPATLLLVFRGLNVDASILQKEILDKCSSTQNEQIFSSLLLMINLSNTSRTHHCSKDHVIQQSTCSLYTVYTKIYNTVYSMIKLQHLYAAINYCVACLSWCYKLKKMNNMCRYSCPHCQDFEKTMIDSMKVLLQDYSGISLSPILVLKKRTCHEYQRKEDLHVNNPVASNFFHMISTTLPPDVNQRQTLNVEYMQLGVFALTRSLPFISNEKNAFDLFFDTFSLINSLVEFLKVSSNTTLPVLHQLLILTVKLIEEFKLPFWEVDESNAKLMYYCIMRVIFTDIIDQRVTVTAIQVLKHLLVLLVMSDGFDGNLNVKERPFQFFSLVEKLDSTSWEVRDSTLEFFQTMIDMTGPNPLIVKCYFDNDSIEKIFSIGVNDESSYVRASALDFFSRATRAKQFGCHVAPPTLCDHALTAVVDDNTPVVRKVACELVTALYVTYGPNLLSDADAMYDTMWTVIDKDLDWEVKKAALIFWECAMKRHLFDKSIPLHLPSLMNSSLSENKDEVTSQIVAVIKTLGKIGFLKAIWIGLNDDCDLKVAQEALRIMNYLEDVDGDWNFIQHILSTDDTTSSVEEETAQPSSKALEPKEFFYLFKKQDWKEKLSSRRDWIEYTCDDLSSLMDHILNAGSGVNDLDRNAVDCY